MQLVTWAIVETYLLILASLGFDSYALLLLCLHTVFHFAFGLAVEFFQAALSSCSSQVSETEPPNRLLDQPELKLTTTGEVNLHSEAGHTDSYLFHTNSGCNSPISATY